MKTSTFCSFTSSKTLLVTFALLGLSLGSLSAQQLTITPGTNLVLNGNVSLVVNNAALQNNGNFVAGGSTVSFSGQKDSTTAYVSGTNTTVFNNLSVSKSASHMALKSAVVVTNVLAVNAGTLYTDSNLTLRSDINLTARVAAVPSSAKIIGKTNVERYMPARRAWRLMTAPVTGSNSIYSSWQNGGVYTVGKGTLVTGTAPSAANGLDASAQNNSSMKTFNFTTQQFVKVSNTKTAISAGNSGSADNTGYFIFVRGDRNPSNTNLGIDNLTTLTSTGSLQTGRQTFAVSTAAGAYSLVGNPYASPVNFDSLTRTNLIKRFYVWDPSLNSVGGYVMMDDLDNDGVYTSSVFGSAQTKDIQSGQAFFVQTNARPGLTASIAFTESSKSGNSSNVMFRPVHPKAPIGGGTGKLTTLLNLLNANNTTVIADGAIAEFDSAFSAGVDLDDALKFGNTNENFSIVRNNTAMSAERRPVASVNDTVYFKLTTTTQRSYQLVFMAEGLEKPGMLGYLEDSYLGTSTLISLEGNTMVNFSINSQAASAAANRFRLVFRQALTVLPVTISSVTAIEKNSNIAVEWKVENELNMVKYDVEKSTDGSSFTKVNTTNVAGSSNAYNTYSWLDVNAVKGNNFYRIKAYDKSGEVKYSSIVKVSMDKTAASGFSIYPNPVTGNVINLVMSNQPAGTYQVRLTNVTGQTMFVKSVKTSGGNSTESLNAGSKLAAGIYQLEIIGQNNSHNTQKVIVE